MGKDQLSERIEGYPESFRSARGPAFRSLAQIYREQVARYHSNERQPIDKMMTNFMHVGLIRALFPKATVIHIYRNPYAVCLSCFVQNFAREPAWTKTRDQIGRYYRAYVDMMRHWLSLDGLEMHHLSYEDLVTQPEVEMRKICHRLNLDFAPECLHPERAGGIIKTASNTQARKPISTTSIDSWKAYAPYLEELEPHIGNVDWSEMIATGEKP